MPVERLPVRGPRPESPRVFFVLLEFSENRASRENTRRFMAAHAAWIDRGLADGVFLLVGSLEPNLGGAVVAHDTSREELEARVRADPFVAEGVVTARVLEFSVARTDPRLRFLTAQASA